MYQSLYPSLIKYRNLRAIYSLGASNFRNVSSHGKHENDSKNQKRAMLATKLGAIVNVSLAACKGFIGVTVGSTALISDACNSAGDVICDAVVYYSLVQSRTAVSPERPWGQGNPNPSIHLS